jgi:hypothetical protein
MRALAATAARATATAALRTVGHAMAARASSKGASYCWVGHGTCGQSSDAHDYCLGQGGVDRGGAHQGCVGHGGVPHGFVGQCCRGMLA